MIKHWKILEQEDVSPSKWFPVMKQKVELPNGTIIDDYFISPVRNAVMVLPVTRKNEIVLVKQYKHAIGEVIIELPAGFQQKSKSLEESALAELEEEVGITTSLDNLTFLGKTANDPTKTTHVTYCYIARNLDFNSKQNLEITEDIEILKIAPKKVLEMVISGEIWVADSMVNIVRAFFKYPEIFK
jgi:8-oxo-dGTP pyrophosphatase MutT (NUDIX family)